MFSVGPSRAFGAVPDFLSNLPVKRPTCLFDGFNLGWNVARFFKFKPAIKALRRPCRF